MNWSHFTFFAVPALVCFIASAVLAYFHRCKRLCEITSLVGITLMTIFIAGFWIELQRPPMRTMGETRLWYAFFLPICGYLVFKRYKYPFILSFTSILSGVFICINLFKPEIHDKTLMPVLQSFWFTPHVLVYMFAYALLGVGFILSIYRLFSKKGGADLGVTTTELTRIGWVFLLIGMFLGALWAKQAWGHFWTWDPKETWAAATFLCYSLYLHLQIAFPKAQKLACVVQIIGFLLLQMCWYGLQLFPSLSVGSMHLYI